MLSSSSKAHYAIVGRAILAHYSSRLGDEPLANRIFDDYENSQHLRLKRPGKGTGSRGVSWLGAGSVVCSGRPCSQQLRNAYGKGYYAYLSAELEGMALRTELTVQGPEVLPEHLIHAVVELLLLLLKQSIAIKTVAGDETPMARATAEQGKAVYDPIA